MVVSLMATHVTTGMTSLVAWRLTETPVHADEDSLENLLRHSGKHARLTSTGLYTLFRRPCLNAHRAHRRCAMLAKIVTDSVCIQRLFDEDMILA